MRNLIAVVTLTLELAIKEPILGFSEPSSESCQMVLWRVSPLTVGLTPLSARLSLSAWNQRKARF